MFYALIRGFVIGFAVAFPVGPVWMLCFRNAIYFGFWAGFFSGFGASVAEAFYGICLGFGSSIIADFMVRYSVLMNVIGALIIGYLGFMAIRTSAEAEVAVQKTERWGLFFGESLLLMLLNPMTIILFFSLYTSVGVAGGLWTELSLAAGVFLGALSWFSSLSFVSSWAGKWMSLRTLTWVNRAGGIILIGFALSSAYTAFVAWVNMFPQPPLS